MLAAQYLLQSGQKDERPADELQAELGTLKHQLDMNAQTNAGVVDQFRQRQAEIAALKDTIEDREEKLSKVEQRITRTRVSMIVILVKTTYLVNLRNFGSLV